MVFNTDIVTPMRKMTKYQSEKLISQLHPVDRAWAAGFFDGEGCFSDKGSGRILCSIVQVDSEVLHKFCKIVGVGTVLGPYSPPSHKGRPFYRWAASGRYAVHVAEVMWPYLGEVKKNRYRTIIDIENSRQL